MNPKITQVLDSTSKRFDEEFPLGFFASENYPGSAEDGELKFVMWQDDQTKRATYRKERVLSALLQSNLELLAAVREVIRSKMPILYSEDAGKHNRNIGATEALTDLLIALSEGKEKV